MRGRRLTATEQVQQPSKLQPTLDSPAVEYPFTNETSVIIALVQSLLWQRRKWIIWASVRNMDNAAGGPVGWIPFHPMGCFQDSRRKT